MFGDIYNVTSQYFQPKAQKIIIRFIVWINILFVKKLSWCNIFKSEPPNHDFTLMSESIWTFIGATKTIFKSSSVVIITKASSSGILFLWTSKEINDPKFQYHFGHSNNFQNWTHKFDYESVTKKLILFAFNYLSMFAALNIIIRFFNIKILKMTSI